MRVARNAGGGLFARASNGQLWHISHLASYVDWSSWESLGGSVVGNPAVGRDSADGGLRVFVRGTDRTIYLPKGTKDRNGSGGCADGN